MNFLYVYDYSAEHTWTNGLPVEGESVTIPKGKAVLVDVDSTPILGTIVVEGALIFKPNASVSHQRLFDAHMIIVRGGMLQVGTAAIPYLSKLTITLHRKKHDLE